MGKGREAGGTGGRSDGLGREVGLAWEERRGPHSLRLEVGEDG